METRIYTWQPVELRAATDDEPAKIVGVAAVFYDGTPQTEYRVGGYTERIEPGAFDQAVREDDIFALFNHQEDMVLGRRKAGTLDLTIDQRGLNYVITPSNTTISSNLVEMIRRNEVTGSSFSFRPRHKGERWEQNGRDQPVIRTLTDVMVRDVGPATFPAYKATETSLRSASDEAIRSFLARRDSQVEDELAGYFTRVAFATVGCLD